MTHARLVLGALGATALLAVGCGSSSEESADTTAATSTQAAETVPAAAPVPSQDGKAPSKAQYVRRADAICREANAVGKRANAEVQRAVEARDREAAAAAIERYAPDFEAKVNEVAELRQPDKDQRILQGLIKVMQAQVGAFKTEAQALRRNDDAMVQRVLETQKKSREYAETLASTYGFEVCGRAG